MRTINPPALDASQVYSRISQSRRDVVTRTRLLQAQPVVELAYSAYLASVDELGVLQQADTVPASGDDLRGNYGSKSRETTRLRADVLQANVGGRCPLCGQGQATTIDHYLPQDSFPEFAILPVNLVPCCWQCNHAKGRNYARNSETSYLHVYFDVITENDRFLFADLEVLPLGLKIRYFVAPPVSLSERLRKRLTSHFERLDLASYYLKEGINEVTERCDSVEAQLMAGGPCAVRTYLRQEMASVAAARGVNYWRYAILDAMARSEEICDGSFLRHMRVDAEIRGDEPVGE